LEDVKEVSIFYWHFAKVSSILSKHMSGEASQRKSSAYGEVGLSRKSHCMISRHSSESYGRYGYIIPCSEGKMDMQCVVVNIPFGAAHVANKSNAAVEVIRHSIGRSTK
jgi:hypothetical protein